MTLRLVMIGSTSVFDDGDILKEDEVANYALNLDKVSNKFNANQDELPSVT